MPRRNQAAKVLNSVLQREAYIISIDAPKLSILAPVSIIDRKMRRARPRPHG